METYAIQFLTTTSGLRSPAYTGTLIQLRDLLVDAIERVNAEHEKAIEEADDDYIIDTELNNQFVIVLARFYEDDQDEPQMEFCDMPIYALEYAVEIFNDKAEAA